MDFRASGASNERRRRVLSEESASAPATLPIRRKTNGQADGPRTQGPRYSDDGRPDRQPRLMDLVPRRWLVQSLLACSTTAVLALLVLWHAVAQERGQAWPAALVRLANIDAAGSLASWVRGALVAAAGTFAVLIYVVRRHRTDDYRGRYRVWLWAATWMLVMSVDQVARLREAWQATAVWEFGWIGPAQGALWWAMPCGLAALAIGVRLALEMRECRPSLGLFILATVLWATGEALGHAVGSVTPTAGIVAASLAVAGQWALAFSMSLHARHVVLDAAGLLRKRKKRRAVKPPAGETAAPKETLADAGKPVAQQHRPAAPPAQRPAPSAAPPASAPTLTFGGRAAPTENKLSKAERKALKQQMRRAG